MLTILWNQCGVIPTPAFRGDSDTSSTAVTEMGTTRASYTTPRQLITQDDKDIVDISSILFSLLDMFDSK